MLYSWFFFINFLSFIDEPYNENLNLKLDETTKKAWESEIVEPLDDPEMIEENLFKEEYLLLNT